MCPECRKPMIVFELEGIEIDRCLTCAGTWLDAGELERIIERSGAQGGGAPPHVPEREGVPQPSPGTGPGGLVAQRSGEARRGRRRCPRCRRRLKAAHAGRLVPLEIDRCPRGCGLWFDRGEMESLVMSSREGEPGAAARFFSDLYRHELSTRPGGS